MRWDSNSVFNIRRCACKFAICFWLVYTSWSFVVSHSNIHRSSRSCCCRFISFYIINIETKVKLERDAQGKLGRVFFYFDFFFFLILIFIYMYSSKMNSQFECCFIVSNGNSSSSNFALLSHRISIILGGSCTFCCCCHHCQTRRARARAFFYVTKPSRIILLCVCVCAVKPVR